MGKFIDLSNQKFGRWTVIEKGGTYKDGDTKWLCICDCGTLREVSSRGLRKGRTKSCGCLKDELTIQHGHNKGGKSTRIYRIWHGMRNRCNNPNSKDYPSYGERGIKVCDEWNDFEIFLEWALNNGYQDDLQIDRIDVNKGYNPKNCRFVTAKQNCNNRRSSSFLRIDNVTKTFPEWSEVSGIGVETLRQRYKRGWRGRKILSPIRGVETNGTTK